MYLYATKDFQTQKAKYQQQKEELDIGTLDTTAYDKPSLDDNTICLIKAATYQTIIKEIDCYIRSMTIDKIDHILKKQRQKAPEVRRQTTSKRHV